jgi:hypothetical protein
VGSPPAAGRSDRSTACRDRREHRPRSVCSQRGRYPCCALKICPGPSTFRGRSASHSFRRGFSRTLLCCRFNPEYLTSLLLLPLLERERLLSGNWKIQPAAGPYFKRAWCARVDEVPADLDVVRYWNLAATEKTEINDPDWTINVKLGRDRNGGYWLLDIMRGYPALASAANGTGLVTVPPEAEGIMRTMPTIASVGSLLIPSFGIEVVRVASWADWVSLRTEPNGERAPEIGDRVNPTDTAGGVWPHYSVNAAVLSLPADRVLNARLSSRQRPRHSRRRFSTSNAYKRVVSRRFCLSHKNDKGWNTHLPHVGSDRSASQHAHRNSRLV